MADANGTLIKMEGVKKVFLTDEVETHALSEIHLEIKKGQYVSILPRCASARSRAPHRTIDVCVPPYSLENRF